MIKQQRARDGSSPQWHRRWHLQWHSQWHRGHLRWDPGGVAGCPSACHGSVFRNAPGCAGCDRADAFCRNSLRFAESPW